MSVIKYANVMHAKLWLIKAEIKINYSFKIYQFKNLQNNECIGQNIEIPLKKPINSIVSSAIANEKPTINLKIEYFKFFFK